MKLKRIALFSPHCCKRTSLLLQTNITLLQWRITLQYSLTMLGVNQAWNFQILWMF